MNQASININRLSGPTNLLKYAKIRNLSISVEGNETNFATKAVKLAILLLGALVMPSKYSFFPGMARVRV
jgi:hypothetical protein